MGCNYYVGKIEESQCKCCGQDLPKNANQIHIGKSSAGWVFMLHSIPGEGLTTLTKWINFLKKKNNRGGIYDEYGRKITLAGLIKKIKERRGTKRKHNIDVGPEYYMDDEIFLYRNKKLNSRLYGRGKSWDVISGEFS